MIDQAWQIFRASLSRIPWDHATAELSNLLSTFAEEFEVDASVHSLRALTVWGQLARYYRPLRRLEHAQRAGIGRYDPVPKPRAKAAAKAAAPARQGPGPAPADTVQGAAPSAPAVAAGAPVALAAPEPAAPHAEAPEAPDASPDEAPELERAGGNVDDEVSSSQPTVSVEEHVAPESAVEDVGVAHQEGGEEEELDQDEEVKSEPESIYQPLRPGSGSPRSRSPPGDPKASSSSRLSARGQPLILHPPTKAFPTVRIDSSGVWVRQSGPPSVPVAITDPHPQNEGETSSQEFSGEEHELPDEAWLYPASYRRSHRQPGVPRGVEQHTIGTAEEDATFGEQQAKGSRRRPASAPLPSTKVRRTESPATSRVLPNLPQNPEEAQPYEGEIAPRLVAPRIASNPKVTLTQGASARPPAAKGVLRVARTPPQPPPAKRPAPHLPCRPAQEAEAEPLSLLSRATIWAEREARAAKAASPKVVLLAKGAAAPKAHQGPQAEVKQKAGPAQRGRSSSPAAAAKGTSTGRARSTGDRTDNVFVAAPLTARERGSPTAKALAPQVAAPRYKVPPTDRQGVPYKIAPGPPPKAKGAAASAPTYKGPPSEVYLAPLRKGFTPPVPRKAPPGSVEPVHAQRQAYHHWHQSQAANPGLASPPTQLLPPNPISSPPAVNPDSRRPITVVLDWKDTLSLDWQEKGQKFGPSFIADFRDFALEFRPINVQILSFTGHANAHTYEQTCLVPAQRELLKALQDISANSSVRYQQCFSRTGAGGKAVLLHTYSPPTSAIVDDNLQILEESSRTGCWTYRANEPGTTRSIGHLLTQLASDLRRVGRHNAPLARALTPSEYVRDPRAEPRHSWR